MGVRTHIELSVNAGFGASLDDTLFQRDVSELLDTLDHAVAQVITLAGGEADYEVNFGDVTQPRLVYVEAEGDVDVKLWGSGGQAVAVRRPIDPASSSAADILSFLLMTGTFTSMHITNADATNSVRIRVLIVGDLVS